MAISLTISAKQNYRNIAANTSNITVTVSYSWTYASNNRYGVPLTVKIDGETYNYSGLILNANMTGSGSGVLKTVTVDVPHNADGTKTVYFSASCKTGLNSGTVAANGSKVLVAIPKEAKITAAPNFNDEQNPTISYSNPFGNEIEVDACISLTGAKDDIAYRTISATGTSYTFNLTEAERNVLRKAFPNSNSGTVRFYVRSKLDDSITKLDYIERTFSIINANPTLNPTITDTNQKTIALTGDTNKLVRYYSIANVNVGAAGTKGATIKSQKATHYNNTAITAATGTFKTIENDAFDFSATDSRNKKVSKRITGNVVPYIHLTINDAHNLPTVDGNYTFKVKGNCFNRSFGAVNNDLQVFYRYKADGDFSEWAAMTVSITDKENSVISTYTAEVAITGLDYQTTYIFEAYAADKLETVYTDEISVKASPVFDWSANDFNLNVPLNMEDATVLRINGDNNNLVISANDAKDGIFLRPNGTGSNEGQVYVDKSGNIRMLNGAAVSFAGNGTTVPINGIQLLSSIFILGHPSYSIMLNGNAVNIGNANTSVTIAGRKYGSNVLLWEGESYMGDGQEITLSAAVSKQPNGIVLIFSRYNSDTGTADDGNFNSFFVPKYLVSEWSGYGSCYNMNTVNYSLATTKYLYITDTEILGNSLNTSSGTGASGIKYNNSAYVLRYVIGV